jgi:hypothetical protein
MREGEMEEKTAACIENTVCNVVLMICTTFLIKGCMESVNEAAIERIKAKNVVVSKP